MKEFVAVKELPLLEGHKNLYITFDFMLKGEVELERQTYFGFLLYSPGPYDVDRAVISGYGIMISPLDPSGIVTENISLVDVPIYFPSVPMDSSLDVVLGADESSFLASGELFQPITRGVHAILPDTIYSAKMEIGEHHQLNFYIKDDDEWALILSGPSHTPVNSISGMNTEGYSAIDHHFDYVSVFAVSELENVSWGITNIQIKHFGDRKAYFVFDIRVKNPELGKIPLYISGTQPPAENGNVWEVKIKPPNLDWRNAGYITTSDCTGDVCQKIIDFTDSDLYGDTEKRLLVGLTHVAPDSVENPINLSLDFVSFQQDPPYVNPGGKFDVWVNWGDIEFGTDTISVSEENILFASMIDFRPSLGPVATIDAVHVNGQEAGFRVIPSNYSRGSINESWRMIIDTFIFPGDTLEIDYHYLTGISDIQSIFDSKYISAKPVARFFWPIKLDLTLYGEDIDEDEVSEIVSKFLQEHKNGFYLGDILFVLKNSGVPVEDIEGEISYIDELGVPTTLSDRRFTLPENHFRFKLGSITVV